MVKNHNLNIVCLADQMQENKLIFRLFSNYQSPKVKSDKYGKFLIEKSCFLFGNINSLFLIFYVFWKIIFQLFGLFFKFFIIISFVENESNYFPMEIKLLINVNISTRYVWFFPN
jgi:hypothetical protein